MYYFFYKMLKNIYAEKIKYIYKMYYYIMYIYISYKYRQNILANLLSIWTLIAHPILNAAFVKYLNFSSAPVILKNILLNNGLQF